MKNKQDGNVNMEQQGGQILPPFLLGFVVALLFILIPTLSSFFWVCGDIDFRSGEKSTCPRLIRKSPQDTRRGWLKRLGVGLTRNEEKEELLILKLDPRESACRVLVSTWSSIWKRNESFDPVCIPDIIDENLADDTAATTIARDEFETAYTSEFLRLTTEQKKLVIGLGQRVASKVENWKARASKVNWGGPAGPAWFAPSKLTGVAELEQLDGGNLFYSYLRIMNWPSQFTSNFPFKLCAKGCHSEDALQHTLEFREKFKPWVVSPSAIKENSHGCIFHHGFSPPYSADENGSHSLVSFPTALSVSIIQA